jgi:ribosomal protein S8
MQNIKVYSRAFNPIRISFKALLVLTTNTYASHLILNTPKGLITHREAIRHRVGGVLVAVIL